MPALINTFLLIEPMKHYLNYGSVVLHQIVEANKRAGQTITELIGNDATPENTFEKLNTLQPILFVLIGHGNTDVTSVECTAVLVRDDSSELILFKDKIVSLCSCLTAQILGPAIIDAGAVAYTGYKQEFWFFIGDEAGTTPAVQSPFLCFHPDTTIAGDFKPITDYSVGDHIIGVSGEQKTLETFRHNYRGSMTTIRASGMLPITVTPEHRFLVASGKPRWKKWNGKKRSPRTVISDRAWKSANMLKPKKAFRSGDYLLIPKIKGTVDIRTVDLKMFTNECGLRVVTSIGRPLVFPINDETAWILGLYVADGFSHTNGICFSFGKHEKELIHHLRVAFEKLGYKSCESEAERCMNVVVPSILLKRAFRLWCGSGAQNKQVPEFIFYHTNQEILKSFIKGYIQGDGAVISQILEGKKYFRLTATTVSKKLALELQLLCAKLGGLLCIQHNDSREGIIRGKKIHCKERWLLSSQSPSILSIFGYAELPLNDNHSFKDLGEYLAVPIRKISTSYYEGDVYNLETPDNTYLANNLVAHNCEFQFVGSLLQGKSVADARKDQLAKYDEEIAYWTSGAGKNNVNSMELSRILEMNKGNSVFLGEGYITPSPGPTVLSAGANPIPFVVAGVLLGIAFYKELAA